VVCDGSNSSNPDHPVKVNQDGSSKKKKKDNIQQVATDTAMTVTMLTKQLSKATVGYLLMVKVRAIN